MMMLGGNLYLLTLVSIIAATSSRFEVDEFNDEVNLKLTFDDDTFDDVLILQPFYLNEKERLAAEKDNCKFLGHLASDQDASVALTGCLNEEDVQITILSRKIPLQKMFFNLKLDGEIEDLTTVSLTKSFLKFCLLFLINHFRNLKKPMVKALKVMKLSIESHMWKIQFLKIVF